MSSAPSVVPGRKEGKKEGSRQHALVFVTLDALWRRRRWLRRLQGRNGLYIERRERRRKSRRSWFVGHGVGWVGIRGSDREAIQPAGTGLVQKCNTYAGSFFGFDDGHVGGLLVGCVRRLDWRWVHVLCGSGPVESN